MRNHLHDIECISITAPPHGQVASRSSFPMAGELSCKRCPLNCGPNCKFGKRQLAGQAKFAQKEANFLCKKGQLFVQKMAQFWAPKMDPFLWPQNAFPIQIQ